ncbi:hypothetical protein HYS28_01415 [Candidatus Uhrbacteria bacterium]|nr:hypothetical protein [Candidatus Uhrbacteria bacterium]
MFELVVFYIVYMVFLSAALGLGSVVGARVPRTRRRPVAIGAIFGFVFFFLSTIVVALMGMHNAMSIIVACAVVHNFSGGLLIRFVLQIISERHRSADAIRRLYPDDHVQ